MRRTTISNPYDPSGELKSVRLNFETCEMEGPDAWTNYFKNREGWVPYVEFNSQNEWVLGMKPTAAVAIPKGKKDWATLTLADLKTECGKRGIPYTEQNTAGDLVAALRLKESKQ